MRRLLGQLYVQVLVAAAIGAVIGLAWPEAGVALKPVADAFIKLIKMFLAPIIFGTVVVGIARMGDLKDVGRIGAKALIYFELLSTIALLIGLAAVNLFRPGAGVHMAASTTDSTALAGYTAAAHEQGFVAFLLDIIPNTIVDAFAKGAMLQIILLALLFGIAAARMGDRARPTVQMIDDLLQLVFHIVNMVMRLAPLGAGAGIAFTIGAYGIGTLWSLAQLIAVLYSAALLFVVVVLGAVMRFAGLSLVGLLRYLREEILIVFGTCSTEAVLPQLMRKLEAIGIARPVVGLVLPAGYTFNADGTSLYLGIATIFVAQATGTALGWTDQLIILGILLLTSKGSAGVAGAGFVTLAATLSTLHSIPVSGLALLLGVDRFLNVARAVTNLIGNSVATIAVARWDGAIDLAQARAVLARPPAPADS
jgi:aerobic C4-dicarboxylate transport protein